jgi:4-hydroxybenzoate polyprenyltransferase
MTDSVPASEAAGQSLARTLVSALRPRQWTKNLAVFAPLLFSKSALHLVSTGRAAVAVLTYCLLASAIYVLNDWVDKEQDRIHPEKRLRPIAAGLLSGKSAFILGGICGLLGLGIASTLGPTFVALALSYVGLQLAYIFVLKRWVIVDVVVIALGFVLRVVSGGVAIDVPVSNWLYLCTLLLAFFLGFAKRRSELASLQESALAHRKSLSEYSVPMLDQMISVVAAACIVSYGLYTVAEDTVAKVGSDGLKYTVPLVLYGIFRYLFLIHRRGAGGSPERVLLSDIPLLVDVGLFVVIAAMVLYVQ